MVATAAKEQWKTSDGFVYPGMKTTKEANQHPQRLDDARLSELAKVCYFVLLFLKLLRRMN